MANRLVNFQEHAFDVWIGHQYQDMPESEFACPVSSNGKTRDQVVSEYQYWFYEELCRNPEFNQKIKSLQGKTLGCHCPPARCHGEVIVNFLNGIQRYKLEKGA